MRFSHSKKHPLAGNWRNGPRFILGRTKALLGHPLFWLLTVAGNSLMIGAAALLFWWERGQNPHLHRFLDALWWSVATVTTVGFGQMTPVSSQGKVLGIGLMIFGSALFSSFTALFATVLLEPEVQEVEEELKEIERAMEHQP